MEVKERLKRLARRVGMLTLYAFAGLILILVVFQRYLIYHPRHYGPGTRAAIKSQGGELLEFQTGSGRQVAIYFPPSDTKLPPAHIWALFNGNAAVALDWLPTVRGYPLRESTGFLLVDYPGFGFSEGSANPTSMQAASDGAFQALADHLHMASKDLESKTGALGMSLGSAACLQFAARHHLRAVVLMAPFRRMSDMAARTIGPLGRLLLTHRFDNAARLDEISRMTPPPPVYILHGGADEIIPAAQSADLAVAHPDMIQRQVVPYVSHNGLYATIDQYVIPWMVARDKSS